MKHALAGATPRLARLRPLHAALGGMLAFCLTISLLFELGVRQGQTAFWLDRALQGIDTTRQIGISLETASAEGRAFLTATDPPSKQRFDDAAAESLSRIDTLRTLSADDSALQDEIGTLEQLATRRLDVLRTAIALKQHGPADEFAALIRSDRGRRLMDAAMRTLDRIVERERAILAARAARATSAARWLLVGQTIGAATAAACLVGFLGLAAATRARRRHMARLAAQVRARTAELHDSELRFRNYFETSPDGLLVLRRDGCDCAVKRANRAAADMLGRSPEALIGRRLRELWPEPTVTDATQCFDQVLTTGRAASFAVTSHASGHVLSLDVRVAAVSAAAEPPLLLVTMRDVSERIRIEEQLHQAQKVEAVGRLAAGMAHDFNNVLQGVSGNLELLSDRLGAGAEARQLIQLAMDAITRGAALTHHLLSFVRKQSLQPRHVDVAALLEDIEVLLSRTLGPHIPVRLRVAAGLPLVHVDPEQLQTAILNLASNAVQAMPYGGRLLLEASERTADADPAARQVVIAVSDTGCGIDDTTLPHVFEPFFTTKGNEGTGLGLSTVQAFAERSGGEVTLHSDVGRGTRVEIRLPMAAGPPAEATRHDASGARADVSAGRVLLVDDMADVLVTVGAFLEDAGLEVVRCETPAQAKAQLAGGARFDAVVTDYAMGEMNGVELIRVCRALHPGLPAVLITGLALDAELAGLAQDTLVLRKPFQRARLLNALNIVMEPTRA